MSQATSSLKQQKYDAGAARVDMKLEVALIPVSDVDREHSALEPDTTSSTESVPRRKPTSFFEEGPPQAMEVAPSFCVVGLAAIFSFSEPVR